MHVIDLRKRPPEDEYVVNPAEVSKMEVTNNCIRIYTFTGYFILIDGNDYIQLREKLTGLITT